MLPAQERHPRQIEHDPHRRNYRPDHCRRLSMTLQRASRHPIRPSSLPILLGLLRSDVFPLLGHRALHEEYEGDQTKREDAEEPEVVEVRQ